MESFQELGLPAFLAHSLKQMNFVKPMPVQAQAIPAALEGKDVIASAQTGTGKTAAFGIPLLAFLENHKDKSALILTPTRELAMQVLEVLRQLAGQHHLGGSVLLIGGAPMGPQLNILSRKPRLVIGTPGRVIDHLNRGSLLLSQTGFLVLDEADRMLDMGFEPQLEEIRKRLSPQRQTLLFSATIPSNIREMGARYLKDPVRITVGSTTQPLSKIAQMVVYTSEVKKPDELLFELKERQGSVVVFARTQHRVDRIMNRLKEEGLKVTRIHGGRTQSQRKQALDQFRMGNYLILVATDIAARGLDIHHIAHVINYDLPRNPEDYIHRVGRTARAGAEGASLCFLTPEDRELWGRITRLMGSPKESIQVKPSRFGDFSPKPGAPIAHVRKQGHPGRRDHARPGQPSGGHRHDPRGGRPDFRKEGSQGRRDFRPRDGKRPDSGFREARPSSFDGARGQGRGDFPPRHPTSPNGLRGTGGSGRHAGGPARSHGAPGARPEGRPQGDRSVFPSSNLNRKNRHPEGRHQRRSEQHHRNTGFGNKDSMGNSIIFHGSQDRQAPQYDPGKKPLDEGPEEQSFNRADSNPGDRSGNRSGGSLPVPRPFPQDRPNPSRGQRPQRFGKNFPPRGNFKKRDH